MEFRICFENCPHLVTALKFLNEIGRRPSCFEGLKIWIGASKHDDSSLSMKNLYGCVLSKLGAIILDCEFDAIISKRVECDAILMFTFTPGISARAIELVVTSQFRDDGVKDTITVFMPSNFKNGYISRKLAKHIIGGKLFFEKKEKIEELNILVFKKCISSLIDMINDREKEMELTFKPTVAILTALPKEFSSMEFFLAEKRIDKSWGPDAIQFPHGKIGEHSIVLGMTGAGNNLSSAIATKILDKYPSVIYTIVVGIAGGIPDFTDPHKHVALGDIVLSNEIGVIQYDMVKRKDDETEFNFKPRPPHATLFRNASAYLEPLNRKEYKFWKYIEDISKERKISRPETVVLDESPWFEDSVNIIDPKKRNAIRPEMPFLHFGPIASANTVLKDPNVRNKLKQNFGAKAVEMEASGVADAAWLEGKFTFVVRGICDYANPDKNDVWQEYASAIAAAFTKAFIEDTLYKST